MRTKIAALRFGVIALLPALAIFPSHAAADQDAARGRQIFARCAACHAVVPNAPRKFGPSLAGVVGRRAGTVAGFNYSRGMRASRLTWTPDNIDRFIQNPQALVPGTTMVAPPIPSSADRRALIIYLRNPAP